MNTEKLIIECPDCETKFNLKSDSLVGVKEPKFHCSKCDNIFEVINLDSDEEDQRNLTDPDTDDSFESPLSSKIKDSDYDKSFLSKKTESFNVSATSSLLDSSTEVANSPKSDSLLDNDFLNSFPDASDENSVLDKTNSKEDSNELENDMQHYQSEQLDLDDYYKKRAEEMQGKYASPNLKEQIFCEKLNFKNTLTIFSPLLVLLLALGIFSFFLSQNPEYSTKLMSGIIGKTPKVAPVKIIVNNRKLKKLILDSGEKVVLVSGVLINETNKHYNEVIIEAIAFDENGMKLKNQKAHLNSSLVRTRISALNPRMIQTLQKRKPIKKLNFAPGARMNFVVALLDDASDAELIYKTISYNARVFSVM